MSREQLIRPDLNNPNFQRQLFELGKEDQRRLLLTLKKLSRMTWDQAYQDPGLKWETITSRKGPKGERVYSLRMSKKFRALGFREKSWLRLLSLHPDHDSAYTK